MSKISVFHVEYNIYEKLKLFQNINNNNYT